MTDNFFGYSEMSEPWISRTIRVSGLAGIFECRLLAKALLGHVLRLTLSSVRAISFTEQSVWWGCSQKNARSSVSLLIADFMMLSNLLSREKNPSQTFKWVGTAATADIEIWLEGVRPRAYVDGARQRDIWCDNHQWISHVYCFFRRGCFADHFAWHICRKYSGTLWFLCDWCRSMFSSLHLWRLNGLLEARGSSQWLSHRYQITFGSYKRCPSFFIFERTFSLKITKKAKKKEVLGSFMAKSVFSEVRQ